MSIDLKNLSITKAHEALLSGEYSVRELTDAYLAEIEKKNGDINAYLEIYNDIDEQVKKAEARFKDGTATLLTGIPLAVKDNILFQGKVSGAASKALDGYTGSYTATVLQKFIDENAILIGRTNMDEFALGSSTETSAYGVTRNPLDTERVPGGSSGGSAAAVAMDGALFALGSETCGSIRQPAAFCNLVGFKPTYGSVSRRGLIAMGNSLDQIGPLAKTVEDAEIIAKMLAFHDPLDATSVPLEKRIAKQEGGTKKIGVPDFCYSLDGVDPEVRASFNRSLDIFKDAGYEIVPLSLPLMPYSLAVYYVVMPAEVSTNLSRFDGIRYGNRAEAASLYELYTKTRGKGFGREARRRILLGTYVLSHGYYDAYYNKAVLLRESIARELDEAFEKVDFIVNPTTPTPPFKIGEKMSDPVAMYLSDVFNAPANITGCPSIAIPSYPTSEGLPLSIQITAPRWKDETLFSLGKEFESRV